MDLRLLEDMLVTFTEVGLVDRDRPTEQTPVGWYSRQVEGRPVTCQVNRDGLKLISDIVDLLRTDGKIARSLRYGEVKDCVIAAAVRAAYHADRGDLDPGVLVSELWDAVTDGEVISTVVIPVHGLTIPPGHSVEIAGLTIGPLPPGQVRHLRSDVRAIGKTVRVGKDGVPGSALPLMLKNFRKLMRGGPCWAVGQVTGRDEAIERISSERLTIALDVLRTFALYLGIDPHHVHLGVSTPKAVKMSLELRPGEAMKWNASPAERRGPLELTEGLLNRLKQWNLFQRAQAIVSSENRSATEQKILLAIMQYGETSCISADWARLQGYLSVLETVLAKEGDQSDRPKKVARRLALFWTEGNRAQPKKLVGDLYNLRRFPVHYGHRTLGGHEVVTETAIDQARNLAYIAVILALERVVGYSNHGDFIDALDKEALGT